MIRSEADVSVGRSGIFQGDIRARRVVVNGELRGKVDCDRLEVVAGGQVFGDVTLEEIIIEAGGLFEGQSRRRTKDSVAVLSHDGRKQPILPAAEAAAANPAEKSESGTPA
jgi:cytoskeletal protein CcmA (bactofilin family)